MVDDGSNGGARTILRYWKEIKVILHETNMGKGTAIRSGLTLVSDGYVIVS